MTDRWADKAIEDMKASYKAEIAALRTRIEELERERDNDDLPQAPWPASDWAVNRIAELEQKLERVLGSLTRMTDIAEARLVMITDLESRLAEARADALEEAAKVADGYIGMGWRGSELPESIRALKSGGANG